MTNAKQTLLKLTAKSVQIVGRVSSK